MHMTSLYRILHRKVVHIQDDEYVTSLALKAMHNIYSTVH